MTPMKSMEMEDEDKLDAVHPIAMATKPDYPYGLRISLTEKELDRLGLDPSAAFEGGIVHLHALARITNCSQNVDHENDRASCRIELQIENMSIESEDEENKES